MPKIFIQHPDGKCETFDYCPDTLETVLSNVKWLPPPKSAAQKLADYGKSLFARKSNQR